MAKLAPFHRLNPPLLQNSLSSESPSLPRLFSSLDDLGELKTSNSVKAIHAQMIKMSTRNKMDTKGKTLVTCYLEFGDSRSAAMAFFVGSAHNYLSWSSFLEEFRRFGNDPEEILMFFCEFHNGGLVFDRRVLSLVLKLCGSLKDLWLGLQIHAYLIKRGFDWDVYLNCALINFYGTCWGIESANKLFDEMPNKEDVLWDEVIKLNLKHGRWVKALEVFRNMQLSFAKPSSTAIVNALQACAKERALDEGKQIHGYVLRWKLESNVSICNSLINMYSKNGRLELAKAVFDSMNHHNLSSWNSIISSYAALGGLNDAWILYNEMESSDVKPDIVTWNCLLSGHSLHGSFDAVLAILKRMQDSGFKPNSSSISSVLQTVTELCCLKHGKEIHGFVIRNGLDYDVYVGTSLVDMYVKNNCLSFAKLVFHNMKNKNNFAWNSLISGYSFKGLFEDAERLLNSMVQERIKPDLVTWNGLVSGYAMKGRHKEALAAIHRMKSSGLTPNVVSWTALISGCSQNENHADSLKYFVRMQEEGIRANSATISSLLKACAGLSLLRKGEEIHCLSIRKGFVEDVFVATALVDMYSKAGNFRSACEVFRTIKNKTLPSWNCMILGFAIYGSAKEAISLFNEMRGAGLQPDAITFTALLSGCKNSGLVDEGWKLYDSMCTDYNIAPTIEHFSCMVDILGRAGFLDEAWDFIQTMPLKPDATIWGAFLASCIIHKNLEFAETAAKHLFELEPHNPANYVLMMNLYSMSNRGADVERLKDLMRKAGVRHSPVWSWTQIDQKIHMFFAEGKPHPDLGEIYFELYHLVSKMKKLGYEPDISCVHQNIDAVEKKKMLLSHTEKLAITYGLMKMKNGEPIRVVNNTRVCSDCHTAAKYMSLVQKCEIFLKDGTRFHHFREGKCTCNDCW